MLWPVIEGGVEAVLVGDGDPAPPVQHHGLRGLEVVQVDCLHTPPQPQLSHLEAEPPGTISQKMYKAIKLGRPV